MFLKIAQLEAAEAKEDYDGDGDERKVEQQLFEQPTFQLEQQSECAIYVRHVMAILYQRLKLSYRDIRSLCCQILMPALFAMIGPRRRKQPARTKAELLGPAARRVPQKDLRRQVEHVLG